MINKNKIATIVLVSILFFNLKICLGQEQKPELAYYNIECFLDIKEKKIKASQIVNFTNKYNTKLHEIVFHLYPNSYSSYETIPIIGDYFDKKHLSKDDLGEIVIDKVMVKNKKVRFYVHDQIIILFLEEPLERGDSLDIKIDFTLQLPHGRYRLGYFENIYSITNWYPILSIYDEKSQTWDKNPYHPVGEPNFGDVSHYFVRVIIPNNMTIVSTGNIVAKTIKKDLEIIDIKAENVRDFIFIVGNNYDILEDEIYNIKIRIFYIPETIKKTNVDFLSKKEIAAIVLNYVKEAAKFFSDTFGKYPYNKIDIVETNLEGGAMEYPQVLQMSNFSDLSRNFNSDNIPWIIEAAVHETAHQWWRVAVGNDEYREPFMDEAFAQYSTALFFEKRYGKDHPQGAYKAFREYISPHELPPLDSSVDEFDNWAQYTKTIYQRGPLLLEDLRFLIGEEEFLKILRAYYNKYFLKNGSINDFLKVIEEVSGEEVRNYIKASIKNKKYSPDHLLYTY